MNSQHFVLSYIQHCSGGALIRTECGPMWQMLVIAALLLLAIATLILLRFYSVPARSAASSGSPSGTSGFGP
jgi:hypothetical protein